MRSRAFRRPAAGYGRGVAGFETALDGSWRVERLSGLVPPLPIRKRIAGDSGVTLVGPVRLPFRVEGTTLRYRAPLHAFVDELEPSGEGFVGRARVLGREYGRFRLVRK
jgi:hypothetical protein